MADDRKQAQLDFYAALERINNEGQPKLEIPTAKSSVAAAYDGIAASMEGSLWNMGLYDPDMAAEIEAQVPHLANLLTDGLSEQLYYFTLRQVPLDLADYGARSVLEVGSGSGGGLNFLSRVASADRMVGLDISPDAVRRANSMFSRGRKLGFVQGDAEKLPFDDNEFDVVINVESAHNYPDVGAFLAEVSRVLKPGGHFSYVDLYTAERFEVVRRVKAAVPGLTWVDEVDVTDRVKAAIRQRMAPDSQLRTRIEEKLKTLPTIVRPQLRVMMLGGFGYWFAGYRESGLVRWLGKRTGILPPPLPFRTYHLSLARKS
jgi:SAM-dependent methyltransferase